MRNPVTQRQYLEGLLMAFKVDGSVVTTTAGVNTGLLVGQHLATIYKGTAANSNLVTITLRKPLGLLPYCVKFQSVTLDCVCRLEAAVTKTVIQVRTLLHSNLATGLDDADFEMFIFGNEGIREGLY